MFQLIESIRIENKQLNHIDLHNARFNKAAKAIFKTSKIVNLEDFISIPENISNQRYKCRISFDGENFATEITPYVQRSIKTIKLVEMNEVEYSFKTNQRELLNKAYELRGDCDDIIITKNELLTDAWAANIILFNGERWYTPDCPLLEGTQRQYLLNSGKIISKKISKHNLKEFQSIKLINAMIDFERADTIEISNLYY